MSAHRHLEPADGCGARGVRDSTKVRRIAVLSGALMAPDRELTEGHAPAKIDPLS